MVHRHLPVDGLLGIVCYTDDMKLSIERQLKASNLTLPVHARTEWYF
ncbi:DarT ssDNA thymidine ADP-ribosyltransferase family protein [Xanthomonas populi]